MGDHASRKDASSNEPTRAGAPTEAFWADAAQGITQPLIDPRVPGVAADASVMLPWIDEDHDASADTSPTNAGRWLTDRLGGTVPRPTPKHDQANAAGARDDAPVLWGTTPRIAPTPAERLPLTLAPTLPLIIPDKGSRALREGWWQAFAASVSTAGERHTEMCAVLNAYRNADQDGELDALRYVSNGNVADVSTYTNNQRVPNQGGPRVGDLFAKDETDRESLVLDDSDRTGIRAAAGAVVRGEGDVESSGRRTFDSDLSTKAFRGRLATAGHRARIAAHTLEATVSRLQGVAATRRKERIAREKLEGFQGKLSKATGIVRTLKNVAASIAFVANREVGDAITSIGDAVEGTMNLLGEFHADRIQQEIADAGLEQLDFVEEEALHQYQSALAAVTGVSSEIVTARNDLKVSLGGRRDAHDTFASNAAKAAAATGTSHQSQAKLRAMLSAIPLVDTALLRAQQLSAASEPLAMSAPAMRGYGMAQSHHHPVAAVFARATDELVGTHAMAEKEVALWQSRLRELESVKATILGHHPLRDED